MPKWTPERESDLSKVAQPELGVELDPHDFWFIERNTLLHFCKTGDSIEVTKKIIPLITTASASTSKNTN